MLSVGKFQNILEMNVVVYMCVCVRMALDNLQTYNANSAVRT